MLNLNDITAIHSRDIIWLHKKHKDWVRDKSTTIVTNEDDANELPSRKGLKKMIIIWPKLTFLKTIKLGQMKSIS